MRQPSESSKLAKNSTQATPTTPTVQATANSERVEYPTVWLDSRMIRAKFSEQPVSYRIRINGTQWNRETHCDEHALFECTYEAYHPLMALGQAVVEYSQTARTSISDIHVSRRVVKKSNR